MRHIGENLTVCFLFTSLIASLSISVTHFSWHASNLIDYACQDCISNAADNQLSP